VTAAVTQSVHSKPETVANLSAHTKQFVSGNPTAGRHVSVSRRLRCEPPPHRLAPHTQRFSPAGTNRPQTDRLAPSKPRRPKKANSGPAFPVHSKSPPLGHAASPGLRRHTKNHKKSSAPLSFSAFPANSLTLPFSRTADTTGGNQALQ
jgi:hypothetical protein